MNDRVNKINTPDGALELWGGQGFIALKDTMGSDLTVVNSARVSFAKEVQEFDLDKDGKLLDFLAKHKHHSPYRHCYLQFHLKAPEAIMRQTYKHVIGIEWTPNGCPTKDHAWNEISGRYIEYDDIYVPEQFRPQSKDNKQASEDGDLSDVIAAHRAEGLSTEGEAVSVRKIYQETIDLCKHAYQTLINAGVAKEQARLVMPFATMTEVYWTCSLQAACHFINLRAHAGAQFEIREMADAVKQLTEIHFPHSTEAFLKYL